MHFVDEIRERKQPMKNRRGDVVGKIAVDTDAAASGSGAEIRFEDVAQDDAQIGKFFGESLETGDERRVELDGVDRRAGRGKIFGHFAVAGADFDPAIVPGRVGWHRGVGRNADGARDLFTPVGVGKEMLAKALTSHTAEKCSRNAITALRRRENYLLSGLTGWGASGSVH
jgi:hypothetical protein